MTFVHYDDYLPVRAVFQIVVAIPDNFIFEILQDQKHLRVGYLSVLICEQFLKIETHEVFIGFKTGRAVPKVGIPSARFEFGDIIFNDFQTRAVIVIARLNEFFIDERGKVVKGRIVRRRES